VPRTLVERSSGNDLTIPDIRTRRDLDILSRITFNVPALGDPDGWNVRFGRELNASDDREHFQRAPGADGLPVIEGKQIRPFGVDVAAARFTLAPRVAARLIDPNRSFRRMRLAYRDVASPTNRLTLIAALIPAGAITTHTLFCLKDPLDDTSQHYLCGMFNSYVANFLVRLRVGTHVTAAIIDRLPVPKPARHAAAFAEIAALSAGLSAGRADVRACARLQAVAARLYGLERLELQHILDTFPLVPRPEREAAMAAFCDIVT
jgi:hypothetical protein